MKRCIHAYHHSRVDGSDAGWVCARPDGTLCEIVPPGCFACLCYEPWDEAYVLDACILLMRALWENQVQHTYRLPLDIRNHPRMVK